AKLPATGPTLMYGLHPTGPLEVLGAMSLALTRRSDVKVVAVNEFKYLGNTRDYFLGVDFVSPEPERTENNRRLRQAVKAHLQSGGALIIFPSAKPARRVDGRLWEPPFNPSAAKYGLEFDATLVPFMMDTRLTDRFYRASRRLRFAVLWRYALHARRAGRLDFRLGDPLDMAEYKAATAATAGDLAAIGRLNDLMRGRVDLLAPDYHPGSVTPPTILYGLHPTGPLEVLGAMSLALTRRPDVKVVAVNEFKYLGNTRDYFFGVDFVSPEPERIENNRRIRAAIKRHLESGGALIIFPSAKPARRVDGRLWEPPFNPSAAKYGREFSATMVPFMMDTRLSDRFYRASGRSRFAALWRYALYARKAGRLDFRVGEPIDPAPFTAVPGATAEDLAAVARLNDLMRIRADLLAPDYHPGSFTPPTIVREREAAARKAARAALRQADSTGVRRRIRSRS
ncbi:MAG TPA: hypothetical protein VEX42_09265, partial [Microbacterium sp.]|nr:hypothetical protein [Microbacterium sp.]